MDKISVIITHWAMNKERSEMMRVSLTSLFESEDNLEIIVVDNGESPTDSEWLLNQTHEEKIACYVRNRKNMHFGYARNQGLRLATGNFIVIADNDILYRPGWATSCVNFLNQNDGKYIATPIAPDPMNNVAKRWVGEVGGWKLNTRAGSNCFMMRKNDQSEIGEFIIHRIAGSHYCDRFAFLGYTVAVMPSPKVFDMGLRKGYNIKKEIENKEL